ncbi:dUTP diphosphatase [Rikenella microfusus]|uniref:dUTP diphosphatase n=1 Tax=Rikenella microfusus TaxID=28139 RepID=UPI003A945470
MEKVKVINRSGNPLPAYETSQAVGLDVRADIRESWTIGPLERVMVPTGLYFQIPEGYEIQVRPRSGLAAKHGIAVINSPGTIDPDYRGELKVLLVNLSNEPFEMQPGERVAQLVFARYQRLEWEETVVLDETKRGGGGFGSTGVK